MHARNTFLLHKPGQNPNVVWAVAKGRKYDCLEQAVKRCSHLRSLLDEAAKNDPSAREIWYAKYHQKATKSTRTKKNTFNRNVEKAVETGTFRLLNVAGGLVAKTELVAALQPLGSIAAVARLVLGLDPLDEPNGARGYPALWNLLIGPIAHEKIPGIKGHKPTDHVSKYLNFKMESWYRLVAGRVLMVHANLKPARKPGKCLDAVLVQQDTQDRAEYTRMCRRVKEERVLWEHEAETTRTADMVAGDDPKDAEDAASAVSISDEEIPYDSPKTPVDNSLSTLLHHQNNASQHDDDENSQDLLRDQTHHNSGDQDGYDSDDQHQRDKDNTRELVLRMGAKLPQKRVVVNPDNSDDDATQLSTQPIPEANGPPKQQGSKKRPPPPAHEPPPTPKKSKARKQGQAQGQIYTTGVVYSGV